MSLYKKENSVQLYDVNGVPVTKTLYTQVGNIDKSDQYNVFVKTEYSQPSTQSNPLISEEFFYVSDFNTRGFDGWQTFNQFSETIFYNSPQLGYESHRGTCLVLSTSNNFNDLTMVRLSPGTPSIPLDVQGVEVGGEFSFKSQDKNFPYAFRFGLDCQPNTNRGWAMAEYRINTLGQSFTFDPAGSTRALGSSWRVNTSSNDTLVFSDVPTGIQNIPANEPGKPTIVTCKLKLDVSGQDNLRFVDYNQLTCNGKIMDLSTLNVNGESINWDYNEGMNVLLQAVNRPTNYLATQTFSNHMNLFVHSYALRFIY